MRTSLTSFRRLFFSTKRPSIAEKEQQLAANQLLQLRREKNSALCPSCNTFVNNYKYLKHLKHCATDLLPPNFRTAWPGATIAAQHAQTMETKLRENIVTLKFKEKQTVQDIATQLGLTIKRIERSAKLASKSIPLVIDPPNPNVTVIFEDKDILVVNKPPGINHHPKHRWQGGSLLNCVMGHIQENGGDPTTVGPVTRLDRDTSGVCVFAKTKASASITGLLLTGSSANKTSHKQYLALTEPNKHNGTDVGHCLQPQSVAIGEEFIVNKALALGPRRINAPPLMLVTPTFEGGKTSTTNFQLLDRSMDGHELLFCTLETGRTHQIRVHLQSAGRSILGDMTYGRGAKLSNEEDEVVTCIDRQALHAYRLRFKHPRSLRVVEFVAKPPKDFMDALKCVGVTLPV